MSGDIIQLNPEAFQTELKGLVKNSVGLIHISLSLYYFAVIMMFHLVKPFHFLRQCSIMLWYLSARRFTTACPTERCLPLCSGCFTAAAAICI